MSGRRQNLTSKNKKRSSRGQNNSKYCGLSLRKCQKLPQTHRKLADLWLRNTSCSFAEFAVAELSVNLRCPALVFCIQFIYEEALGEFLLSFYLIYEIYFN